MDKGFILKSKITIPELSRNVLLTDRIKKLHEKINSSRAVTICGRAAEHLAKCGDSDAAMDMVTRDGFTLTRLISTAESSMLHGIRSRLNKS